jgi:predicted O-methyltransferase YrrM
MSYPTKVSATNKNILEKKMISNTNKKIHSIIGDVPYMRLDQADKIRNLIIKEKLQSVLELGFFHGVSTCYIAGAVAELEGGKVTCIDLVKAQGAKPNVEQLLESVGLRDIVNVYFEPTSYTWRLMKMIEENQKPIFNLCYLDGAHNWFVDGFAFFLVDRLLKPGGWIIFDDINWTYAESPSMRDLDEVMAMPVDERTTPQVRKVYDLLVKQHPSYGNFRLDGDWAYAQKIEASAIDLPQVRRETVVERHYVGLGPAIKKIYNRMTSGV